MKFSERYGHTTPRQTLQIEDIDDALRNSLWNAFYSNWISSLRFIARDLAHTSHFQYYHLDAAAREIAELIWCDYLKEPIDPLERMDRNSLINTLREHFFKWPWYQVYDFIEFCIQQKFFPTLGSRVNQFLEKELAGYRVIDGTITPVTDIAEITALETALADSKFPSVQAHLANALRLLSLRPEPDLRNSCKESISAVEGICREITGEKSFGKALAMLTTKHGLPENLKGSFNQLYGWTSNENGIRHPIMETPDLTVDLTKYFLLSCTSFTNYLKTLKT